MGYVIMIQSCGGFLLANRWRYDLLNSVIILKYEMYFYIKIYKEEICFVFFEKKA